MSILEQMDLKRDYLRPLIARIAMPAITDCVFLDSEINTNRTSVLRERLDAAGLKDDEVRADINGVFNTVEWTILSVTDTEKVRCMPLSSRHAG
jgi:limonene-1,2-epoxide hydrolase